MPSFTNTFGGTNVYSANVSYRAVALTANVTLTWPTELATDTNVVASIMDVTPSGAGLTIRMPDASQASVGETALFFNVGASSFTVADNGGNTIQTIATGEAWQVYLTGNATVNGTWRSIEYGAGTSAPSASALAGAGLKAITTTLNQAAPTTLLSADYTLASLDRARVLVWNGGAGTFTMPSAASVGNDWFFDARNSGSGGLTIAPAGGELVNGQASLTFNPGDSARILTDGANFYTIGYGQSATFAFDYVSISLTGLPSPYTLSGTNLNRIAYQFSGILTANMQIIVPNTIQQYWVRNVTTGAYSLTVKTAAGTGIAVVQNGAAILYCDGTNVVEADTNNLSTPIGIAQGGTGATTAGTALINLGGTSLGIGLFTATNPATARAAIGAAGAGANADITSLSGLTTPLSVAQGGTGQTTFTNGQLLIGNTTGNTLAKSTLTAGAGITITNGTGSITIASTGPDAFPGAGIAYSTGTAWGTSYTTSGTGTTLALSASPALTGTPTAPTATLGTSTTQLATTAFVTSTAFSGALPGQAGNAGKFVTTDGTNASWSFVPLATGVTGALPVANGGTGATDAGTARANLSAAASGAVTGSGLTMATSRLLGRTTAATGAIEEISIGAGLALSGGSLSSTALSSTNLQEFSASGTWTKPVGATVVLVECWGAGGGGGSGARAVGSSGGGGGGGGGYNYKLFDAADLSATVTVTIGAGGAGGAAITTDNTNGATGSAGGISTFGSLLTGYAGGGGGAGSGSNNAGGGGGGATGSATTSSGGSGPTVGVFGGASGSAGGVGVPAGFGGASGGGGATSQSQPGARGLYSGSGAGSGAPSLASTNNITSTSSVTGYLASSGAGGSAINVVNASATTNLVFGNGTFAVTTGQGVIATSADGLSWSLSAAVASVTFTTIIYNGSNWVAIGNNNIFYTSSDLVTWTAAGSLADQVFIRWFAYNGSLYVAVTDGGRIFTSTDLATWTQRTSGTTATLYLIVWDGTRWIVSGSSGVILRSTDGVTWTAATTAPGGSLVLNALIAAGGLVLTQANNGQVYRSTDGGDTFTIATTTISTLASGSFAYDGTTFVLAGSSLVYTSTDGNTWTLQTDGTTDTYQGAAFGDSLFVVGSNTANTNVAITSSDSGVTWVARTVSALQAASTAGQAGGLTCGGGGGGSSVNGFNSGAGGNGGSGFVRVTTW